MMEYGPGLPVQACTLAVFSLEYEGVGQRPCALRTLREPAAALKKASFALRAVCV